VHAPLAGKQATALRPNLAARRWARRPAGRADPARAARRIGWAFITSDFVGTTGYSGKPIHIMVALDDAARSSGSSSSSIPSRSC
jgi:hypothetical protein